jgi:hypothetical protein
MEHIVQRFTRYKSMVYNSKTYGLQGLNLWFIRRKPMLYVVQTYALALVKITSSQPSLLTPYSLLLTTYYLLPIT